MLSYVDILRTDVSEDLIASTVRVTIFGELATLAVTSNKSTLRTNIICSMLRMSVNANAVPSLSILVQTDDGGDKSLRNVGS
jgi:hypothetical protein